MATYGLTPNGPNPKRLDVILEEMHTKLSERTGVNTRQNQESLLNHLLTNIADRIAELWEFGVDVYYSQYPSSAEHSSLDNALQFNGVTREMPAPSYYHILCKALDGTTVPAGTIIASDTNPSVNLVLGIPGRVARSSFNKAVVVPATDNPVNAMSVVLNGNLFSGNSLEELAEAIDDEAFTAICSEGKLIIEAADETSANTMVLSENLTTETVSSIIMFPTEEPGDIVLPNGAITKIVRAVPGLQAVENVGPYIAGRLTETDVETRKSYVAKIYHGSSSMLESIKSAILEKVQGVTSVAAYQNDTNVVDAQGRPPHSIEVVVDGGDKQKIAEQILEKKAGGISTFCVEGENGETVTLKGVYGEDIAIRFNRPSRVYVWFRVGVTFSANVYPPTNYPELIKETLLECMEQVGAGADVIPQKFTEQLHNKVPGIDYFDISLFATRDPQESPSDYPERSVVVSARERAVTSESRIGVVIDG